MMVGRSEREAALCASMADLAYVEVQAPEDFTARVLAALSAGPAARRRAARLAVIGARERVWGVGRRGAAGAAGWASRNRLSLRNGALASSAIVMGAVAIGLEARHARRSRRVGTV